MKLFIIWKKLKEEERRESIKKAEVDQVVVAVEAVAKVVARLITYLLKKRNIEREAVLQNLVK